MHATYLGHSTVALEAGGLRVLTDPLLRSSLFGALRRRRPIPEVETSDLGAVLISHAHHDHLDLRTVRSLPRSTPFVVPRGVGSLIRRKGFEEVIELSAGESLQIGELAITATPTVHEAARRSGAPGGESIGFLLESGGASTYFAGDTALFDGLSEISDDLDLALIPIWGWGPTLGPGHLGPEAAAQALELLRPRIAVPVHWGTYTPIGSPRLWPWMIDGPAKLFAEHAARRAPATEIRVLEPGEGIALEVAA